MSHKRQTSSRVLVIVSFALLCIGIFLELLHISGGLNLRATYNFESVVPNAVGLISNADVREAGVDIGKVTGVSNRGASAVIEISLAKRYGPIYKNATVRVRTKTLVGENYLQLDPGSPSAGAVPAGGVLPISQAQDAVQLDQLLSTLTAPRQARLRRLIAGIGGGVSGSGEADLNATLDALSGTVSNAAPVAQALATQSQQLASLVDNLGQVFTALGDRSAQIQQLATNGLTAANTVASQSQALRQALRDLPSTLTTAQTSTTLLAAVGTDASPVLDNLGAALDQLDPGLRALPAAGTATLSALNRLHAVAPLANQLLGALRATVKPTAAAIPPLGNLLRELRPMIAYLAPYAPDIAHLFAVLESAGSAHDATGELGRVLPIISSAAVLTLTGPEKQALQALQALGVAQVLNLKGPNAYPAPGTATSPTAMLGPYPHIQRDTGR